uniref:Uncharacterized protein n=1 Tax=Rhizophora mucronata TaxID=61149 RepID=A0A2P2QVX9_RHIMU
MKTMTKNSPSNQAITFLIFTILSVALNIHQNYAEGN